MTEEASHPGKLRVIVVGGGVAALETAFALNDLAPDQTDVTVLAPNTEFVYRPMTVREPFAYGSAAAIRSSRLSTMPARSSSPASWPGWTPTSRRSTPRRRADRVRRADARARREAIPHYTHALTIDDRRMDDTLHGLIQDVEGGYLKSLAFVSPGRMAWPLPLYELALMTAARAYDMQIGLSVTIVTPEDAPLGDLRLHGQWCRQRAARKGGYRVDRLRPRRDPHRTASGHQPR